MTPRWSSCSSPRVPSGSIMTGPSPTAQTQQATLHSPMFWPSTAGRCFSERWSIAIAHRGIWSSPSRSRNCARWIKSAHSTALQPHFRSRLNLSMATILLNKIFLRSLPTFQTRRVPRACAIGPIGRFRSKLFPRSVFLTWSMAKFHPRRSPAKTFLWVSRPSSQPIFCRSPGKTGFPGSMSMPSERKRSVKAARSALAGFQLCWWPSHFLDGSCASAAESAP